MNYIPNDIINYSISFFTKLDLLMFSHVNKHFSRCSKQSQNHMLKYKKIIFTISEDYGDDYEHCPTDELFFIQAIQDGYLDILIYLIDDINIYSQVWKLQICSYAAANGHIEILKW